MYDTRMGMIISDTQGRAFRSGAVGVAVGISGITPYLDCVGLKDLYGKSLKSTIICVADELSSAASIIMGQANNGYCLVLIRGVSYFDEIKCNSYDSCIQDILRDEENDLFR